MATELKLQVVLDAMDRITAPLKRIRGAAGPAGQELKQLRDRMKDLESAQKGIGEFREMSRGLASTGSALSQARDRVSALAKEMRATATPSAALRREFNSAVKTAQSLSRQHDQQQIKLQQVRNSLSAAGISTKNLAQTERNLRTDISNTNRQIDAQRERLSKLAEETRKVGRAREEFERTRNFAGQTAMAGAAAGAVGYGILRGGANLMGEGASFEQTMSRVRALSRLDSNSEELTAMREQARKLGAETMFSATEAAQGQAFLAMAGFKPQDIMAAMPGVLDVAKAGDLDLAQTADIASNILTGFNLRAEEMARVGDVLTATFTRSNTSMYMLGETMKYAAPNAAAYGQDIEVIAAATGKLGDAGIQGSMAGTALRAILSRLAAPPKAAAEALDELGIRVQDAHGNMRPLPDLLQEIHEKTKTLGNAHRGGLLKDIAGEEAASALTVLSQQAGSGGLQEFITEIRAAGGEAARTAKVMGDNITGDLDELSSAWSDIKITLFDDNVGAMRSTIQSITRLVGSVGEWAKQNPGLVSTITKVVAVVGVLAAAFSGVALALASVLVPLAAVKFGFTVAGVKAAGAMGAMRSVLPGVVTGFNALRSALPMVLTAVRSIGVAMASTPLGMAAVAIGAAAMLIVRYWQPIKAFFSGLFSGIRQALAPMQSAFREAFSALGPVAGIFTGIGRAVSRVFGWLTRLVLPIDTSSEALQGFTSAGQRVGAVVGGAIRLLLTPVRSVAQALRALALLVTGQWQELGGMLGSAWEGAVAAVSNALSGIRSAVSRVFGSIAATISGWSPLESMRERLAAGIQSLGAGWQQVHAMAEHAVARVGQVLGGLAGRAGDALSAARSAVAAGMAATSETISSWAVAILGGIGASWAGLRDIMGSAWEGARGAVTAAIGGISAALSAWSPLDVLRQQFGSAMSWMQTLPDQFSSIGAQIMGGLVSGIQSMGAAVKDSVTGMGQRTADWFKEKLGIRSPSRVFADMGAEIPAGTKAGIERAANDPLWAVRNMAAAIAATAVVAPGLSAAAPVNMASSPAAVASAALSPAGQDFLLRPALDGESASALMEKIRHQFGDTLKRTHGIVANITTDLKVDTRPALAAASTAPNVSIGGDTINIHIHPTPGMDPQAIARAVSAELDRRERARDARRRSSMTDYGV